jgi:hypothetical protein
MQQIQVSDKALRVATDRYRAERMMTLGVDRFHFMFQAGFDEFKASVFGQPFIDVQWSSLVTVTASILTFPHHMGKHVKVMNMISKDEGVLLMFHDRNSDDLVCRSLTLGYAQKAMKRLIAYLNSEHVVVGEIMEL